MTFDTHGRTMMGVKPDHAAKQLAEWDVAALGANCGNGADELLAAIRAIHVATPGAVIVAKSNAGLPEYVKGKTVYRATPEHMALHADEALQAGARIIGACCGSTPAHLKAMAVALNN
jgi:5-methyltetrahydrofolate--homocysteine methyltransferase